MLLLALCLGFFIVIMDVIIVNVALPIMAISLHTNIVGLQWIVDGYTLTFASLLLSAGNLADCWGARRVYIGGLLVFVLTSLGCGLSHFLGILVTFRLLQGLSAAFIVPASIALLNNVYQAPKQRAQAIGIWAAVGGAAASAAPFLGAILTAGFNWPAIFLVNVPIGGFAIILSMKYLKKVPTKTLQNFDLGGQITIIVSIAALAFALIEAGHLGWLSKWVILSFILAMVMLVAFIKFELQAKRPLLPLNFFSSRNFSLAIIAGFILSFTSYGLFFLLPLYFLQIRGYSTLLTGFAVAPLLFFSAIMSYTVGKFIARYGYRLPLIMGMLIAASGYLSLLITQANSPHYSYLVLPLIAVGIGSTCVMPAITLAVLQDIPSDRAGLASGALNAARQLGSLLGVAIFGSIINYIGQFILGFHIMLWICSLCSIGISLLTVFIGFSAKKVNVPMDTQIQN